MPGNNNESWHRNAAFGPDRSALEGKLRQASASKRPVYMTAAMRVAQMLGEFDIGALPIDRPRGFRS